MDAAQALADLIEVSSQIEGAVLVGPDGSVEASSWDADGSAASSVAEAARALVSAAEETPPGRAGLTQLHAAASDGSVFCVREGDRMVAAVTRPDPTVGLVLYDLRTCLRLAAEEPKKPTRARKPKKAETAKAGKAAKEQGCVGASWRSRRPAPRRSSGSGAAQPRPTASTSTSRTAR